MPCSPGDCSGRREKGQWGCYSGALGINHLRQRKPRRVSIGERQRAAVVRALAHEPAIVLADEPTASLDRANAEEVMSLLTRTVADQGAALILVTHDEVLARSFDLTINPMPARPERSAVNGSGRLVVYQAARQLLRSRLRIFLMSGRLGWRSCSPSLRSSRPCSS